MKSKTTYVLVFLFLLALLFSLERTCDHKHEAFVHPFLKRVQIKK